ANEAGSVHKSELNAEFHRSPRCPGSSCPGLTWASMLPNKALLRRSMDCRVRPGNDAMAPMRPGSELHADAAIERIGPAAPQRDGEADEAPQQRVLVTADEPGKSSLPIEHRDDEHFHRGGGGKKRVNRPMMSAMPPTNSMTNADQIQGSAGSNPCS